MQAGSFAASCPELGLFCQGDTEEEAVNRIQSLIAFQLTCSQAESLCHADKTNSTKPVTPTRGKVTWEMFYLPHRTNVQ